MLVLLSSQLPQRIEQAPSLIKATRSAWAHQTLEWEPSAARHRHPAEPDHSTAPVLHREAPWSIGAGSPSSCTAVVIHRGPSASSLTSCIHHRWHHHHARAPSHHRRRATPWCTTAPPPIKSSSTVACSSGGHGRLPDPASLGRFLVAGAHS